jgi:hypothetical protein
MSYQSTPEDRKRAYVIGGIYVFLALVLGVMLLKIWPPVPWPAPKNPEDSRRLNALIAEIGCQEPSPSTSASPTATPAGTPATNTPTPTPTATPNTGQPGTQTTPAAGTQPPPTGQTGAPTTGQPATGAGTTPPTGQGAGTTPTTTGAPAGSAVAGQTNPANGVVVDRTGEIISIPINLFGICRRTTFDERLLLLVIVAGILGAFVHGATSLADYIGNNNFNKSWTWFYLLRPGVGMALALVFYFVIRGGFLSTTGGAQDINPYGIAALAGLVGMFSKQATDKLSEVFGTLFRSAPGEGDAKRQDPLSPAPGGARLQLNPTSVVAGGEGLTLQVTGTGFVNGARVQVNDAPQPTTFVSSTALSAQIARETIASPATLRITVVNPDNTRFGPSDLIVSASGEAASPQETTVPGEAALPEETPVAGEGGDQDLIDGCEVEMKADTADEELPVTKGGVG